MKLYHFSDNPAIEQFVPRTLARRPELPAYVWAIEDAHAYRYYFPRDCPRIVCVRTPEMTAEEERTFFGATTAQVVVTVESGWYERIQQCVLYQYHFAPDGFELEDASTGYYVSRQTVVPLSMEPCGQLIERLLALGVELRMTPNLHPLRDAILASAFTGFGIHQFRHAQPRQ